MLNHTNKTKQQLLSELATLSRKLATLEAADHASQEDIKSHTQKEPYLLHLSAIGHIMNSSLELNDVYQSFVEEARHLIVFDRMVIGTLDPNLHQLRIDHTWGIQIKGREPGDTIPLKNTFASKVLHDTTGLRIHLDHPPDIQNQMESASDIRTAGIRSMMIVPLISRAEPAGLLYISTTQPEAYTEDDIRLAENVGSQIAGAVSNSRQYADLKQTEKLLRTRESHLQHLVNMSQTINTSLNIKDICNQFVQEAQPLLQFDRLSVSTLSPTHSFTTCIYVWGHPIPGKNIGDDMPFKDVISAEVQRTGKGQIVQALDMTANRSRFPGAQPVWKSGLRSILMIPLISRDRVFGFLRLASTESEAYTQDDLQLAENFGHQIAGAVLNAQRHDELQQAMVKISQSENRFRNLIEGSWL